MTVEVIIRDSAGKIVAIHKADALLPTRFSIPNDSPLTQVDERAGDHSIRWSFFGFVYQPQVRREVR